MMYPKGKLLDPNSMIYVAILPLFHILSLKTSSKPRQIHIGCLQYKKSSINLSAIKFGTLFLEPMIDQQLVLNRFLGTSLMSRVLLLGLILG